jgi:hypothetical protein
MNVINNNINDNNNKSLGAYEIVLIRAVVSHLFHGCLCCNSSSWPAFALSCRSLLADVKRIERSATLLLSCIENVSDSCNIWYYIISLCLVHLLADT